MYFYKTIIVYIKKLCEVVIFCVEEQNCKFYSLFSVSTCRIVLNV